MSIRNDIKPLYREATRAALIGLFVNLGLGLTKLIGGIVGRSFALISDAVNSLGDVFATLVVLFAFRVAQQPPDAEHPYGHSRAEAIAGSNVAVLIIVSALAIAWEALQRIFVKHDIPPIWTLWIAGGNVVIKEFLYRYKLRIGRKTGSSALIANAWDHRSDALCSLAVLLGLMIVRWGGTACIWADEASAIVVVTAIVWSASLLLRRSCSELMDEQADSEFVDKIRQAATSIEGVRVVEKLWVRKSGLEYFVDIHVEVDGDLSVSEGHRIGHRVKDHLMASFPAIRDALIHLEPFSSKSSHGRP